MNFELPRPMLEYLFDSTVTASILVVLIGILQVTIGRRLSPAWRFLLWMPVLLRLLVPIFPESSLSLYNLLRWGGSAPEVPVAVQAIEFTPSTEPPVIIEVERLTEEERSQWVRHDWGTLLGRAAFLLWVTVTSGLILRLVVGTAWLQWRLHRDASESAGELKGIMAEAAKAVRLGSPPRVRETGLVESPAVFGLVRPSLLLPLGFAERLEPHEIRHVFLHEAAHLKRRDLVVNWLMALAQAIHWFNPLVWLAFRQMRIERELACDAMALRAAAGEDPQEYGRTILRLLEGVTARPRLAGLVGIAEEKHSAKRRLQQIATFTPGHRRYWLALPILLVLVLAGLTNAEDPKTGAEAPLDVSFYLVAEEIPSRDIVAGEVDPGALGLEEVPFFSPADILAYDRSAGVLEVTAEGARRLSIQLFGTPAANAGQKEVYRLWAPENLPFVAVGPEESRYLAILQNPLSSFRYPGLRELSAEVPSIDLDHRGSVRFRFSLNAEKDRLPSHAVRDGTVQGDSIPSANNVPAPKAVTDEAALDGAGAAAVRGAEEPEQLLTRTYRLNAEAFLRILENSQGPIPLAEGDDPLENRTPLQAAVKEFVALAGIEFPAPRPEAPSASPPQSQKAIFFNDRTGILFVRAPLSDMDKLEKALQELNLPAPAPERETGSEEGPLRGIQKSYIPASFVQALEKAQGPFNRPKRNSDGGLPDPRAVQEALRDYFASKGVHFSEALSQRPKYQRGVYFDLETGALVVMTWRGEVHLAMQAIRDLDVPVPQVTIETRAVEFETAADFNRFMTRLMKLQKDPRAVLTRAEFDEVMAGLEKAPGTDILKLPRITTVSGRAARVSVSDIGEPALMLDFHPEYHPLDQTFTLEAAGYREDDSENKQSESGVLYNGQTFILGLARHLVIYEMPMVTHTDDGELVFRSTNVPHLYFITPILIDSAGYLIKNPGDPREEIPPQP